MPRTASNIRTRALQIAKCPKYTSQGLDELNALLDHIAATVDFSAARGQWNFTFNTALATSGGGNIVTAGPNPLPIDYLRVPVSPGSTGSQRSSKWYLQGVPYDMIECDLTELDDQVQQAGMQSYPYLWAKDFAQYQPIVEITATLSSTSPIVTTLAVIDTGTVLTGIAVGMSVAGGIGPYSVIPPGTTITTVTGNPPTSLTLSNNPTMSLTGASLLIGNPAQAFSWPAPSGAYNAMIRYQRRMPRLTEAQLTAGAYCWFEDDEALVDGLAGQMMRYTNDSRVVEFIGAGLGTGDGRFGKKLAQYLSLADDNANRAQTVQLDRRRFGRNLSQLPITKATGW